MSSDLKTAGYGAYKAYLAAKIPLNARKMNEKAANFIKWSDLSDAGQLRLREDYGRYLDSLPPTCSLETKIERFRRWLREEHQIVFDAM
ncbi:MAG: hypothetical protein ABFS23_04200 [Pseudomonadota bacterium]